MTIRHDLGGSLPDALEALECGEPDLEVLDVMSPDSEKWLGLCLLATCAVPTSLAVSLFLAGRDAIEDDVKGLGGDDDLVFSADSLWDVMLAEQPLIDLHRSTSPQQPARTPAIVVKGA